MPKLNNDGVICLSKKGYTNFPVCLFSLSNLSFLCIQRDNLPKYGRTIIKSYLGVILTIDFGANIMSKNLSKHFPTYSR